MFIAAAYSSFGQSQNWWRVNGNTPSATDYLGTQNNTPLIIKTNGTEWMRLTPGGRLGIGTAAPARMLDVNGQSHFRLKVECDSLLEASMLKINGLAGGDGILKTDATGNVNKLPYTGSNTDVFTGVGTFTPLGSLLPAPLWQQGTTGIFHNGHVGINKSNPQYALDIAGDVNVSNNVYVGGGVVIAKRANVDTADFGTGRIVGNGSAVEVIGNFRAMNKLEVQGNAEIAGNLKLSNLGTFSGNTIKAIVADSNGNLKMLGPSPVNPPPVACPNLLNPVSSPFWMVGGQYLNPGDCNYLGSVNNVSMSIGVNTHHIINLGQGVYNNNVSSGKVGINTTPPPGPELSMEVYGSLSIINGGDVSLYLGRNNLIGSGKVAENYGEWGIQYLRSISNNGNPGGLNFWKPFQSTGVNGNGFLFLSDNGNVGVGTTNPQYKLDVNGKVRIGTKAQITGQHTDALFQVYGKSVFLDVWVTMQNWADDEFEKESNLQELEKEVQYAIKNKHLQDVPSEKEVLENGINVNEIISNQLRLIEKLYKYSYLLNNKIRDLEKEIEQLKKEYSQNK